jgi:hypothetical protein
MDLRYLLLMSDIAVSHYDGWMYADDKVFMTALVMTVVLLRTFKPVSSLANNSGRSSR